MVSGRGPLRCRRRYCMSRSLTEAKVLRKLDIPDFRHLTKDKVVSFVSMLPHMDPDVAKHALEQFPAFAETSLAIVNCMRDSLEKIVSSNAENMAEFNARCQEALEALEMELKREDLTEEGRKLVIDGILGIIEAVGQKDSENKEYQKGIFRDILLACAVVVLCMAAPLGLRMNTSLSG